MDELGAAVVANKAVVAVHRQVECVVVAGVDKDELGTSVDRGAAGQTVADHTAVAAGRNEDNGDLAQEPP